MSFLVIGEVTELLRNTLVLGMSQDSVSSAFVNQDSDILLTNPGQLSQGEVRKLSLWLYQILPNGHLRNSGFLRTSDPSDARKDDVQLYPPFFVDLLYLVTPSIQANGIQNAIAEQRLLGRVLQIFHDQSILRLESRENPGEGCELHVSLAPRTIEELAEVWEAMHQPYRLSLCYEVRGVPIRSERSLRDGRTSERATDFAPMEA